MPRKISSGAAVDRIIDMLGKLFPMPPNYEASGDEYDGLQKHFSLIDKLADLICVACFVIGAFLPQWLAPHRDYIFWDLAVMFGMAVLIPSLWVLITTMIRGGKPELLLYLRFYSSKFAIYWKGLLLFVYLPFSLLGIAGIIMAYLL